MARPLAIPLIHRFALPRRVPRISSSPNLGLKPGHFGFTSRVEFPTLDRKLTACHSCAAFETSALQQHDLRGWRNRLLSFGNLVRSLVRADFRSESKAIDAPVPLFSPNFA